MHKVQELQEIEYDLPYHYIPQIRGGEIISELSVDWSYEYLTSIETVLKKFKQFKPNSFLDIGCGDGRLINQISPNYPKTKFFGYDYSEKAIRYANIYKKSDNTYFETKNILNNEQPSREKYDFVTLIEVLEHIPKENAENFLFECLKLVNTGGTFMIIVPHTNKKVIKKHYQHFNKIILTDIFDRYPKEIKIDEIIFLDKVSFINSLLRRIVKNRLYVLYPLWKVYQRQNLNLINKSEKNCGRICMIIKVL